MGPVGIPLRPGRGRGTLPEIHLPRYLRRSRKQHEVAPGMPEAGTERHARPRHRTARHRPHPRQRRKPKVLTRNVTPDQACDPLDSATPGPWILNPNGNILQGDRIEGPVTAAIGLIYRNDPDDKENGDLMAAAPGPRADHRRDAVGVRGGDYGRGVGDGGNLRP